MNGWRGAVAVCWGAMRPRSSIVLRCIKVVCAAGEAANLMNNGVV
jgi:hypothetical protein